MKILVQNSGYHLKNLGDVAMLRAAYGELRRQQPDAEILVYTTDAERLQIFCPGALAAEVLPARTWARVFVFPGRLGRAIARRVRFLDDWWLRLKLEQPQKAVRLLENFGVFFRSELPQIRRFTHEVKSVDMVVATGGGYLNSTFSAHGRVVLTTLGLAQALGKTTAFLGQGVGPFEKGSCLEQLVAKAYGAAFLVSFREKKSSSAFVAKHRLVNTKFTFDDANLLLESSYDDVRENEPCLGLNLRLAKYSGIDSDFPAKFCEILRDLISERGVGLVPLPVATHDSDSDIDALESVASELADGLLTGIPTDSVEELVLRVSRCSVIVTCSYHAGVFGASLGIPVVLLSANGYYDQKLQGLSDAFDGRGVRLVDIRSENWRAEFSKAVIVSLDSSSQRDSQSIELADDYREEVREVYRRLLTHKDAQDKE